MSWKKPGQPSAITLRPLQLCDWFNGKTILKLGYYQTPSLLLPTLFSIMPPHNLP